MSSYTLNGAPLAFGPFEVDDVWHPTSVLELWSDEDLAELGVVRTPDPEPEETPPNEVVPPGPPTKSHLGEYAMSKRWAAMVGGMLFDGFPIPTNEEGRGFISGAHQKASKDATVTKLWQVANSPITFTTFSNAQLIALGDSLDTLVQSTFDTLASVAAGIEAETITDFEEIDLAFAGINRVFTST